LEQLITCSHCGKEHEIAHIEPSLLHPDPVLDIPADLRKKTVTEGKDYSVIWRRPHSKWLRPILARRSGFGRYFLRIMMPFHVAGRDQPINWGVWVEVDREHYRLAHSLWDSPEQHRQPPFPGRVANNLEGYPPTIGLPGSVQLESPGRVPTFVLDDRDHPLVAEQRNGVTESDVLRWLRPIVHPQ
jgi:hypothetical protein